MVSPLLACVVMGSSDYIQSTLDACSTIVCLQVGYFYFSFLLDEGIPKGVCYRSTWSDLPRIDGGFASDVALTRLPGLSNGLGMSDCQMDSLTNCKRKHRNNRKCRNSRVKTLFEPSNPVCSCYTLPHLLKALSSKLQGWYQVRAMQIVVVVIPVQ